MYCSLNYSIYVILSYEITIEKIYNNKSILNVYMFDYHQIKRIVQVSFMLNFMILNHLYE